LTTQPRQFLQFLSDFTRWASSQPDILAAALLGSYARNEATSASDVDLIIIAKEPKTYLHDTTWAQYFRTINRQRIENYGRVTSLRVWYSGSYEVEYGLTDETWTASPLDKGTQKVISGGMQVLFERGSILSRLKKPTSKSRRSK
jgi:predicted nucleotidyltransferase